jgi:hypothetical protein
MKARPGAHLVASLEGEYTSFVPSEGVYRTDLGLIFRVTETVEGGLKVEVLRDGVWTAGRIGLVGLRLDPSTRKLAPSAILRLPA